ncbi:hypothetical protein DL769_001358 [Monosporascus sp. CRB-8-3]|nr:hypothetical protein DL769_001358 [Monosporascus sp. CRB-8-3]
MSPEAHSHSNIRVFIQWDEQAIFAGEDIKCKITFKNVAPGPNQNQSRSERSRQPSPLLDPSRIKTNDNNNNNGLAPPTPGRGHRSTLSLTVPTAGSRSTGGPQPQPQPQQWPPPQPTPQRPGHAHKRSLSIVSIGSNATVEDQSLNGSPARPQRPGRGHGRSASLQISPRLGSSGGLHSATQPRRPFGSESSPVFNNHSFPPTRHGLSRPGSSTAPNTPSIGTSSRRGPGIIPDFKFPMTPSSRSENHESASNNSARTSPKSPLSGNVTRTDHQKEPIPIIAEHSAPAARILSTTSIAGGTPRSSGEFYSLSNNSSETLASEYVTHPLQTGLRPPHFRRSSGLSTVYQARLPEALMMGYAQVQGSFTLDGSLINLGPFEAVKRKAVLGGQGGGVIGLESSKRSSGLLQSFGWGALSSSIGELLGGGELSSIKELRGAASSKSIPLLSTPQSILFVDLQLGPGESKAYEYTFKLPKGLPPTHKGKAMKISYSLVIGTQRPGGTREQQVHSVSVPFRVLGSVNSHGEILGHDLSSPYVLLRDMAKVQALEKAPGQGENPKNKTSQSTSSINEFLQYVDELLERPRQQGAGLLSPTAVGSSSRRPSVFEEAGTAKEAIDLAILRSNLTRDGGPSSNRFEIARNGRRVGVVMLARPAYRLGESVSMAVDFANAEIPCYAVHMALETSERVEPALALRSEASVHRVTRKVYASLSEAALFARRVVFTPAIPISATPEFVTSGLSLEWKIRIEFVVPSSSASSHASRFAASAVDDDDDESSEEEEVSDSTVSTSNANGGGNDAYPPLRPNRSRSRPSRRPRPQQPQHPPLLEEISRDERGGLVLVAAENLECESFEVAVPIRVYGAVCKGLERLERDEALEEGLPV